MAKSSSSQVSLPENLEPARKSGKNLQKLRRFSFVLVLLILLAGIFVLVTNGIYLWKIRPDQAVIAEVRDTLQNGLPQSAATEAERLAFYQANADKLAGMPEKISSLNQKPWTMAVFAQERYQPK